MSVSILEHFSALNDPRQACKVLYPLPEILLVVLCATMAGADDFVEIEVWGRNKLDFLRRFLPFKSGIPSHDTLNDVFNALPEETFSNCFISWVSTLREKEPDIVAIDGKASRRAHNKAEGKPMLHTVSAWACRQRLVIGQEICEEKSNEITAIPALLERLELTGALVTIDAMGCQTKIAEQIRKKGADYLLGLKGNWPLLHKEVELFFETDANKKMMEHFESIDGDHGRIETRRHSVCHDVQWLLSNNSFPGEWKFKDLSMIAMIESITEREGKICSEKRFYLSSAPLSAKQFAAAVRAHWGIENRLHWLLDVVYHDDLMRLRTDNGPANMATVRHMALNLTHNINDKTSLKCKRKKLGWNDDYLFRAITGVA